MTKRSVEETSRILAEILQEAIDQLDDTNWKLLTEIPVPIWGITKAIQHIGDARSRIKTVLRALG